jgi:hypothetical protein
VRNVAFRYAVLARDLAEDRLGFADAAGAGQAARRLGVRSRTQNTSAPATAELPSR